MYMIILAILAYAIWIGWNDHNNGGSNGLINA